MQNTDQGGGAGKRGGADDRQARLAAKLRQNLVRRKAKARGAAQAAAMQIDGATSHSRSVTPDDSDKET